MLLSGQLEESALDCVMLVYEKDDYDPRECVRFVDVSISPYQFYGCSPVVFCSLGGKANLWLTQHPENLEKCQFF